MAHLKKKIKESCCVKRNKGNPRQKKYVKLYSFPKTNSHFMYFLTVDTGGNGNMGQIIRLSLCPVLSKYRLPCDKRFSPNTSEQSYVFIILHFIPMTQLQVNASCACDVHCSIRTCQEKVFAYHRHLANIRAVSTEGDYFEINIRSFVFKYCSLQFFIVPTYTYKIYERITHFLSNTRPQGGWFWSGAVCECPGSPARSLLTVRVTPGNSH